MIKSFRDDWLRDFYYCGIRSRSIPPTIEKGLFRKIQLIYHASTDLDLRMPPSNHFEKLVGNLQGLHSIRVNRKWRLIFEWDPSRGMATNLYLDNHRY
jgi:proteic killer suppression protein